ncbi:MAG: DMT family transporter [Candidatus Sericytochromatia bacterium]
MIKIFELSFIKNNETKGIIYGVLSIIIFSLTFPMTKIALNHFNSDLVIFGRGFLGAILASIILLVTKQKLPEKKYFKSIFIIALGILFSPIFSSSALKLVDSSHGTIITALSPIITSLIAKFRIKEVQSKAFWIGSIIASSSIIFFSFNSKDSFKLADIYLLIAIIISSFVSAEGGKLSKYLGGWKVISWALVLTLPFTSIKAIPEIYKLNFEYFSISWLSILYIGFISQLLGMFIWYSGMNKIGVSKISQMQLFQPAFGTIFAFFMLGENLSFYGFITLGIVFLSVVFIKHDTSKASLGKSKM